MAGCKGKTGEVSLDCEKYTLPNGLQVVLQEDHSDPVVAVAIQYHVGSARERIGKTGFAHFFEHMLFQRSENLPRNAFFQKISELGGEFNGSTDCDATRYHEIVPRDALEKVLWMESDRMGYFINTVTQGGLEREIDVVSNEKRQNYDTRPYGQLMPILSRYAFPEGHPYSWTTIGELDDLRAATVGDVKEFYKTYYKPNNATLVISGDFDSAKTKELISKYFGEIPAGEPLAAMPAQPAPMDSIRKVFHEDAYASMPMLTLVFPSVPKYHPDAYAVQMLCSVLSEGKNSPLYKVLVDRRQLSPEVEMWYWDRELAGNVALMAPAFEGVDLNDVQAAIDEAFALFETEGFDERVMEGYKAVTEVAFYNSMGGVMRRALQLAEDNTFGGDPLRSFRDMELYKALTKQQVIDAYNKYFKNQNSLRISIVPKGCQALALQGSQRALVTEEKIEEQAMKSGEGELVDNDYDRTPSSFDRSAEPALLANTPALNPPRLWKEQGGENSFTVWGVTSDEMPVVRFCLTLKGGLLCDSPSKPGVASLYAQILTAGTREKTPEQLEEEFRRLGTDLRCEAGTEEIVLSGTCLARNLRGTMDLLTEVLTRPRFDANEFEKARQSTLAGIAQQADDPASIAGVAMRRVMYGQGILANQVFGNAESVAAITLDDLKKYHADYVSPAAANLHFAGNLTPEEARHAVATMRGAWQGAAVALPPDIGGADPAAAGRLCFIDQPGSQQSYILVSCPAMPQGSADYYPAVIANYRLGDGSHSLLFNELRLKRGYTYGAYSGFRCGNRLSRFTLSTQVQGSKTRESAEVILSILQGYASGYTTLDMETTRESILKSSYGAYETLGALVGMLNDISSYDLPEDYVKQRENVLRDITAEQVRGIAASYLDPARMTWVVVGDAATQLERLRDAGLGVPERLDKRGNTIK